MGLLKAIQIEEDYLKTIGNAKAKNAFGLKEKLEAEGFSMDQYHAEKNEFLFNQNTKKLRTVQLEDLHSEEEKVMKKGDSGFFLIVPSKKWVYVGEASTITEPDATYLNIGHQCSSVLATPKDLGIVCVVKHRRALELYQGWVERELIKMGFAPRILATEKALEGYSIYYIQMFFENSEREGMLHSWLQ